MFITTFNFSWSTFLKWHAFIVRVVWFWVYLGVDLSRKNVNNCITLLQTSDHNAVLKPPVDGWLRSSSSILNITKQKGSRDSPGEDTGDFMASGRGATGWTGRVCLAASFFRLIILFSNMSCIDSCFWKTRSTCSCSRERLFEIIFAILNYFSEKRTNVRHCNCSIHLCWMLNA